ncbi:MAG: endonuclease domain-containing protein [Turneriella sp.]
MSLNNLRHLKQRRIELRKRLTPAEAALWNRLKKSQVVDHKFRRQHSFGNYILDFYCPAARLAVELDGGVHQSMEAQDYDRVRDAYLRSAGIRVLRFQNREVLEDMRSVLRRIELLLTDGNLS